MIASRHFLGPLAAMTTTLTDLCEAAQTALRRRVLCELAAAPTTFAALAAALHVTPLILEDHLRRLIEVGLVRSVNGDGVQLTDRVQVSSDAAEYEITLTADDRSTITLTIPID